MHFSVKIWIIIDYFNIWLTKYKVKLKKDKFAVTQTNKNIASTLWKNLPNSNNLVNKYNDIISSDVKIKENVNNKEKTLRKR